MPSRKPCTNPDSPWLAALAWAKDVFAKQQRLSQRPFTEYPVVATLQKRLRPYLLTFDADGKPTGLHADRYEFWLYRQIRKRLQSGELYVDDSLQHRHFSDELISMDEKTDALAQMDIPFLRQPVDAQLDALAAELHEQWLAFNRELKQGTLIRKLCTYTAPNPTRRALLEFDKLVLSIYTLRYLRDPQLERNVHRSQNRIESYHQLRSTIAQVGGKKELTGRTDIEISNQCARLVANTVIYYNSAILSRLLTKYEASGNVKALASITQISPAAWRHILLNGHYTFQSYSKLIDLDALVTGLELG